MKINLVTVGALKEGYLKEAMAEYVKRISRFATLCVTEVADEADAVGAQQIARALDKEAARILDKLRGTVVIFDLDGRQMSSPDLAEFVSNRLQTSSEFTFVIGGSNGLADAIKRKADISVALGRATFPHRLFRVMAAEQIYRLLTIIHNVPYHK